MSLTGTDLSDFENEELDPPQEGQFISRCLCFAISAAPAASFLMKTSEDDEVDVELEWLFLGDSNTVLGVVGVVGKGLGDIIFLGDDKGL
jgi:hypothetical protein